MNKMKYRKCPECGSKMVLRKSQTKGGKFWGCTAWKESGCNGLVPYYGDGARAGLDADIREIKNGYVITTNHKYTDTLEEESTVEVHCPDKESLKAALKATFEIEVEFLCKQIESSTGFTEEVDQEKHEKRIATKKTTKNIQELISQMKGSKEKALTTEVESPDE